MSPKAKTVYRCTECGAEHPKWAGRCDVCGAWNSLVEEVAVRAVATGGASRRAGGTRTLAEGGSVAVTPRLREVSGSEARRWKTGIAFGSSASRLPGARYSVPSGVPRSRRTPMPSKPP